MKLPGLVKVKKTLSFLLAIGVCCLAFLKKNEILYVLRNVDGLWVVIGLFIYYISYIIRAKRICVLSFTELKLWPKGIYAATYHGIASYFLPMRAGDLALPIILKSITSMTILESTKLLVKARLLDISLLGVWIIWAALMPKLPLSNTFRLSWFCSGLLLVLAPWMIRHLAYLSERSSHGLINKIGEVGNFNAISFKEIWLTLLIWLTVGLGQFCVLKAIGLNLSFAEVWLMISIQLPMQLIPIQGIANAGNHEGGWVAVLTLIGIAPKTGLDYAISSHVIFIFYVIALSPLVLITQRIMNRMQDNYP